MLNHAMHAPEPTAPPTEQGTFTLPRPRKAWPNVIGIVSIALGGTGILANAIAILSPFFLEHFASSFGADPEASASMRVQREMTGVVLSVGLVDIAVSILLLGAGIGMCSRSAWAVKAAKVWAVTRLVAALVGTVISYLAMQRIFARHPELAGSNGIGPSDELSILNIGLGVIWACLWPCFLFVWLSLRKVKAEAAHWGTERSEL